MRGGVGQKNSRTSHLHSIRGAAWPAAACFLIAGCGPSAARRATCEAEARVARDSLAELRGFERAADLIVFDGPDDTVPTINEKLQAELLVEAESMGVRTYRLCLEGIR
jgi:hypothetical protein